MATITPPSSRRARAWPSWRPASIFSCDRAADRLIAALSQAAARLSPQSADRAGRALGRLRQRGCPREAQIVRANLRRLGLSRASDPSDERAVVSQTFEAFGLFVVEFFRGLALPNETILAGWTIEGREHLETIATRSRGAILAGAHTGNWEQLGSLTTLTGRRIVAPIGVQFHPRLSAALSRAKARRQIIGVPANRNARELLRALARGDLVALPLDGGLFHQGMNVRLLESELTLAGGAARLAARSGCPILPVFSIRTGFMRQSVRIEAPIFPTGETGEEQRLLQRLADRLGAHLPAARGQWCIFRPLA